MEGRVPGTPERRGGSSHLRIPILTRSPSRASAQPCPPGAHEQSKQPASWQPAWIRTRRRQSLSGPGTYVEAARVGPGLGQSAGAVGNLRQEAGQALLLPVPLPALGGRPGVGVLAEGLLQVPGQGVLRAPDGSHVPGRRGRNRREKNETGWQSRGGQKPSLGSG